MVGEHVRRIAIYLPAMAEYGHRLALGVRNYCEKHPGIAWRDFWYAPELGYLDSSRGVPPWTGWEPDGLIAHACPAEVDMDWLTAGVSQVVVTTPDCGSRFPAVYIDRRAVARMVVEHFRELGVEHFAFVGAAGYSGSNQGAELLAAELATHGKTMLRYDLVANPGEELDHLRNQAATEPGLREFLCAAPRPLGVLTHSDPVARAVCDASLALGLAVPADVAVVGLGDTILAESSIPTLSSIHPPGEDVGFQAMALLCRLIDGQRPENPTVLVPPRELVVRQSTAVRAR